MGDTASKSLVLVAGGLMFAAIGIKKDSIPDPLRYAWAAGAILLFLSLLSDISPQVAGPAAVLVLMAVYWRNRGVIGGATPLGQPQGYTGGGKPGPGGLDQAAAATGKVGQ